MKIQLKDVDLSLMKGITAEMAMKYRIISLKEDKDTIYFYTDKVTYEKRSYLSVAMRKNVEFIEGDEAEVLYLITSCYGQEGINRSEQNFTETQYRNLIKEAIGRDASDIHIEPQDKWTNIRFRIDGVLLLIKKIENDEYTDLVNKIKLEGSMDISDKIKAQDGKISFWIDDKNVYDLRVSSLPTVNKEKIVIRILYKKQELININNLNFTIMQREKIKKLTMLKHGMILVNGPTGSGKSTTLYALLNSINRDGVNISTIEDPVEFNIYGVTQTNVNEKAALTFSTGLKYILRQDPDVILIGEIRDEETAKIAVRASITGHKVYSTIHTNNGLEVYGRLKDMGAEEYLIKEALKGIITQRLVRTLCNCCKVAQRLTREEKIKYGIKPTTVIYKGKGCYECGYTGYKGRTMVCEVIIPSSNMSYESDNFGDELLNSCRTLVEKGIVSLEEYIMLRDGEGLYDEKAQ